MKSKAKKALAAALTTATCLSTLAGSALAAPSTFQDVSSSDWYAEAVQYATENNLFNGTSTTTFSPNGSMTRAMFVTVLGRFSGDTISSTSSRFTDVPSSTWYTSYVNWAAEKGYVNGTSATTFDPEKSITREEIAVVLKNYFSQTGAEIKDDTNVLSSFRDSGDISSWAVDAVDYVRKTGLLSGDEKGNFAPQANLTRAEAATVFMRVGNKVHPEKPTPTPAPNPEYPNAPAGFTFSPSLWDDHEKVLYTDGNYYTAEYVALLKENAVSGMRCNGNAIVPSGEYEWPLEVNFSLNQITDDGRRPPITHIKISVYLKHWDVENGYQWIPMGENVFDESTNLKDGAGKFSFTVPYQVLYDDPYYYLQFVIDDCYDSANNWIYKNNGRFDMKDIFYDAASMLRHEKVFTTTLV